MEGLRAQDHGRVTLKSWKEKDEMPILNWSKWDGLFVFGTAAVGGMIPLYFHLGFIAAGLSSLVTLYFCWDFVRSTPPYVTAFGWMSGLFEYAKRPNKYANTSEAVTRTNPLHAVMETTDSTRNLTGVKRFFPPYGIFEREDGRYAVMLRYEAPNMDFATDQEFLNLMNSLSSHYNDSIDFDISVHTTTRPVDMEKYFSRLEKRMDDPDVENNDIFKALLREMKEGRKQMLEHSETEINHFYITVSVSDSDLGDVASGDDSASERSTLFGLLGGESDGGDEDAAKNRQLKKILDRRASTVEKFTERGGVELEDAEIVRVPVVEAAAVLESYWTGRRVPLDPESESQPLAHDSITVGADEDNVDVEDISEVMN